MKKFTITRVYADEQGESHFGQLTIPLEEAGPIGFLSSAQKVESIIFRKVLPSYDYDFHTAPQRQYIVLLDGEIEIETSSGEKRQLKAGDVVLVEDVTGKGHKTRNLTPSVRNSIFITLS
jgi:mannose-6-phosphate isomerase-like protein (cupin superfamily)